MSKAEKFDKFLEENKITCFNKEEVKNDLHTVVYRAHMEVSGQMLPTMVVADDSIYTMIQVRVAASVVNEGNKQAVLEHINAMNGKYKVFKYYVADNGDICLDSCLTDTEESFDPRFVHTVIDVILRHLTEEYPNLMSLVWAK